MNVTSGVREKNAGRLARGIENRERVYRLLLEERLTVREIARKTGLSKAVVQSRLSRLASANRAYVAGRKKSRHGCSEKVWGARFASCASPGRPSSIEYAGRQEIRGYLWTDMAFA